MARRDVMPGSARPTYAMRLGDDERRIIEAAASLRRMPLSQYIRRTSLSAARRELAGTAGWQESGDPR